MQACPQAIRLQRRGGSLYAAFIRTPSMVGLRKTDKPSLTHETYPLSQQLRHGFNVSEDPDTSDEAETIVGERQRLVEIRHL